MASTQVPLLQLALEAPDVVPDGLDWDVVFVDLNEILSQTEPERHVLPSYLCPVELTEALISQDDHPVPFESNVVPWSSEPLDEGANHSAVPFAQYPVCSGKCLVSQVTRPSQLSLCTMPLCPVVLEEYHFNSQSIPHQQQQQHCHDIRNELASSPPPSQELDLAPANAGHVRIMSPEQRALVLYKRKLRNRQSAKRSRQRGMSVVNDMLAEIRVLKQDSEQVRSSCVETAKENHWLKQQLSMMQKGVN